MIFGEVTTGASNDIEQATKIARAMITQYGMNNDFDMVAMETSATAWPLRAHGRSHDRQPHAFLYLIKQHSSSDILR